MLDQFVENHSLHHSTGLDRDAVAEVRDKIVDGSADGLEAVKKLSVDTAEWAKTTADKVSDEIADRTRRNEPELEIEEEVPWVLQDRDS